MDPDHNTSFVREAGLSIGASGTIVESGVSRILVYETAGRKASIGTNGSYYWVVAELKWSGIPPDTEILWAAEDSLIRATIFRNPVGDKPALTGDMLFDQTYLIVGAKAKQVAQQLPAQVRRALVQAADLRPTVGWRTPTLEQELHIRARPRLRAGVLVPGPIPLGTLLFTPEHAGRACERIVSLARQMEEDSG